MTNVGTGRAPERQGYVLVIEDEDDNLELLGRALHSDVHLWVARNTVEARKILAENRVDLVIADHRLPGETGTALLRSLADERPQVGRFLVTAFADGEDVVSACRQGVVQRFFIKPYSLMRLKAAVLEHLRCHGMAKPRVLIVNSDFSVRSSLHEDLARRSIEAVEADSAHRAQELLDAERFDAAIVDLDMAETCGTDVLAHAQRADPDLPIVLLAAEDYSIGINFLEAGAFDFLAKPVNPAELIMRVERAILAHQQAVEHRRLLNEIKSGPPKVSIVARSAAMRWAVEQVALVAGHDVNVLLTGDTGTGKELVARAIHDASRRAKGPFLALNCGALADALAESELFGHEKGSFTDAKEARLGIFRAATGGTVFLDEVGELSAQSQVRLLRVLETKEVTSLGSSTPVPVDVRVISATCRDLEELVQENRFRRDLFYRLNAFRIGLLPLRERKEDIGPLIELAVARFCASHGLPMAEISAAALMEAREYGWPGNVRELLHAVERALIVGGSSRLDKLDLHRDSFRGAARSRKTSGEDAAGMTAQADGGSLRSPANTAQAPDSDAADFKTRIARLEAQLIVAALEKCRWNKSAASRSLRIPLRTLTHKIRVLGLSVAKQ
jgi:DNA-binding NtrC family response regulator